MPLAIFSFGGFRPFGFWVTFDFSLLWPFGLWNWWLAWLMAFAGFWLLSLVLQSVCLGGSFALLPSAAQNITGQGHLHRGPLHV